MYHEYLDDFQRNFRVKKAVVVLKFKDDGFIVMDCPDNVIQ